MSDGVIMGFQILFGWCYGITIFGLMIGYCHYIIYTNKDK